MKKQLISAVTALAMTACGISNLAVFAEDTQSEGEYTVGITLMQFHSEEVSMGNASMDPLAHIKVNEDGTSVLEIDMHSMNYLGMDGYLGWLKKVTEVVSENKYHYPTEIITVDAEAVEEYVDVYDGFNDPDSEFADNEVVGKWYPKKLSVPLETAFDENGTLMGEDDVLVQVYVPVMESIMEGGGTKFAVIDIDWDSLAVYEPESIAGDVNGDGEFNVADVITLQKWLLAVPDTQLADWKAADLCEDDRLDVFDLCLMKRALIGQTDTTNESN